MEIRKINKSIDELISGGEYLGSGASKEAFLKDGLVYKVPRGRYLIERNGGIDLKFPNTIAEVDGYLADLYDTAEQLVWPLGQFAIELLIWEAFQQLELEGLRIDGLARIIDYFYDKNGVIVIVQEPTENWDKKDEQLNLSYDKMRKELELLAPILEERFDIILRDMGRYNCGLRDGEIKLFDFGISTTTNLDGYGSYSDYSDEWEDDWDEDEE